MTWDEAALETLKRLWESGMSTAKIGKEMGITKNAVIGKAHRIGLPHRAPCVKPPFKYEAKRKERRTKRLVKIKVKRIETRRDAYKGALNIPMSEIVKGCLFGTDMSGQTHLFCGQKYTAYPYCNHHREKAYRSTNAKRH